MVRVVTEIRILIVDDDELSRDLLTVLLEGEGYSVDAAESGDAALLVLDASRDNLPRAVLTDLQMPGLTGPALAGELRSRYGSDVMLLAMSGSKPSPQVSAAFDAFLLKPFSMDDLAKVIAARMPGIEAEAEATPDPGMDLVPELGETGSLNGTLDPKTFQELSEMLRPQQMAELYGLCLRDAEAHVHAMQIAADTGDTPGFQRRAHAMKGSFGMLGARDLQEAATAMETFGPCATNNLTSLEKFKLAMGALRRILIARGLPLDSNGD